MKISRDRLAENRQRILDASAQLLRQNGCGNVSVADITKAAGLTHGAFYNHFASKDDLIAKTFSHVLQPEPIDKRRNLSDINAFSREYLSPFHRDNAGSGCMYAALGSDVPRLSPQTRSVTTKALRDMIEHLSEGAPGDTPEARRRTAISRWAAMVGAMMLARAVDDEALSNELLEETLSSFQEN